MAALTGKRTSSGVSKSNGVKSGLTPSHTPADSPSSTEPPPAKRPRLKLNVRERKQSNDFSGDTIAVSRPRREINSRSRYSQDSDMKGEEAVKTKPPPKQASPAPSSGLSSLSSAPASPLAVSPFQDPSPPASARESYGEFASFYIADAEEDEPPQTEKREKSKAKTKSKQQTKSKSNTETLKPQKQPSPPAPLPKPPPDGQRASSNRPPSPHGPAPALVVPPQAQQRPPPQQAANLSAQATRPKTQQVPSSHPPLGPSGPKAPPPLGPNPGQFGHPAGHPPQHIHPSQPRPVQLPQPIIQFMDIQPDPRPTEPDTVAIMIRKLDALSAALTNFGGIPSIPSSPPPKKPAKPEKPKVPPKKLGLDNPLDGFLSLFGDDDDDSSSSSEEGDPLDYVLPDAGIPDAPLTYGIQFIQNALRSWAQQRITHQVSQQWNFQQAEQFQKQMQAQRRGPGRPRQYEDQPVQPIIQMNLADTPEGIAIKAFQTVLDSGCLQVNKQFPTCLSRSLRILYMQIDHLINQGSKNEAPWQCMSYGAQIRANKIRVEQWKENQAKHQEAMATQHQLSQHQVRQQMGLVPNHPVPPNASQMQHQHMLEMERRRSLQHAVPPPFSGNPHFAPMQYPAPGPPQHFLPSQGPPIAHAASASPANMVPTGDGPRLGSDLSRASQNGLPAPIQTDVVGSVPDKVQRDTPGAAGSPKQQQPSADSRGADAAKTFDSQVPDKRNTGDAAPTVNADRNGDTAMSDAAPLASTSTTAASPQVSPPPSTSTGSLSDESPETIRVASR